MTTEAPPPKRRLPRSEQPSHPSLVGTRLRTRRKFVGNASVSAWCRSGDTSQKSPDGAEAAGTMRRRPYRSGRKEPIVSEPETTEETPEVEVEIEVEATRPAGITFGDPRAVMLDDDWNDD